MPGYIDYEAVSMSDDWDGYLRSLEAPFDLPKSMEVDTFVLYSRRTGSQRGFVVAISHNEVRIASTELICDFDGMMTRFHIRRAIKKSKAIVETIERGWAEVAR